MEEQSEVLANLHGILIVHKDYDQISQLSLYLKEQGYYCDHAKSGLEAIKKFETEDGFKTLIIQENNIPLNAYKTIDYIKTELNKNPYSIVLQEESEGTEIVASQKLVPVDQFYVLGDDINILLQHIKNQGEEDLNVEQSPYYSIDYLKEISDNNTEFIEESLQLFSLSVAKDIGELYLKVKAKDYEEIRKIAHKIKPSFAMVENFKGVELCDEITYKAKEEDFKKLIKELFTEFAEIQNALKRDYPNLNLQ
ncbi:Hpt domain-containing protein [Zunongwangia sp. SCSIO 43204]|uniref:Hpt domain-containing protein n=1 Tax=Zunongwangia sp. SCSIO 43204 TaxID=2779359 RepID=UPI001CAA0C3B|nr:Hpt domain-containing protein [Zunongwangia sp. SCSIO 43204]UAB83763.1 Hpt domain-containing protein [Zunongwangia sp. SCSIO 43204]